MPEVNSGAVTSARSRSCGEAAQGSTLRPVGVKPAAVEISAVLQRDELPTTKRLSTRTFGADARNAFNISLDWSEIVIEFRVHIASNISRSFASKL